MINSSNPSRKRDTTRWKSKNLNTYKPNGKVSNTNAEFEQMSNMNNTLDTDNTEPDTNYKNIQLPTIDISTKQISGSFDWKPPVNQTYTDTIDGLNTAIGKTTGIIYLPSRDAEFIETTTAKLTDILTPPQPEPVPRPERPPETFETLQEPIQESFKSKEDALYTTWNNFINNPSSKTARSVFLLSVYSINELFYIPELIANSIVKSGYSKTRKGSFQNDPNYKKDIDHVKMHLQMIIMVVVSLYASFNWWFLLFYTDHYVNMYEILKLNVFNPFVWIVEPMLEPVAMLNYYLLGKRTEKVFFDTYITPILENKSIFFSVYLIIFNFIYRSTAEYYARTLKDIAEGNPNILYKMVLFIGIFTYMYEVVFNQNNLAFLQSVLLNIVLVIIFYLILFIFVMTACKLSVLFIIMFFSFYSYFPLIAFNSFNPFQIYNAIKRIITDTTEVCVPENPTNNILITIQNFLYKYSAILYFGLLFFGLLIYLFNDTTTFINSEVKKICNIIYICIFLSVVLVAFFQVNNQFSVNTLFNLYQQTTEPSDYTDHVNYKETTTARLITTIILIIEVLMYAPFIILDFVFDYTINPLLKSMNIFNDSYGVSIASFLDHGIFGYGIFGSIFRFLRVNIGTEDINT